MKVRKGDIVRVIAGKFKGVEGEVLQAFPKKSAVIVEGVNVKKKAVKRGESSSNENFIYIQHPIHVSNVKVIKPRSDIRKLDEKTETKEEALSSEKNKTKSSSS